MDWIAVKHAAERLRRAELAYGEMISACEASEIEDAWLDFLAAASTFYSKLEQGVKGNSKSSAWFVAKKAERKDDSLLSYLQHARNQAEHSCRRSVLYAPFKVTVTMEPGEKITITEPPRGMPTVRSKNEASVSGPFLVLKSVMDRGVQYDPPRAHLETAVEGIDAAETAKLGLAYLKTMLSEAEALIA